MTIIAPLRGRPSAPSVYRLDVTMGIPMTSGDGMVVFNLTGGLFSHWLTKISFRLSYIRLRTKTTFFVPLELSNTKLLYAYIECDYGRNAHQYIFATRTFLFDIVWEDRN